MDAKLKLAVTMFGTTFGWVIIFSPVNDGDGWVTYPIGYYWIGGVITAAVWTWAWRWITEIEQDARRDVYRHLGFHPSRRRKPKA
jgi:hypothetical protein